MLKRFLVAAAWVLAPAFAFGQATVIQGGSQTQGHIPAYATTGGTPVVTDGGTAAGGALGVNPSTIGITSRCTNPPCDGSVNSQGGPNGENFAIFDGPTNDADGYHYLGLSANVGGKAVITTGAGGGASPQGLDFIIDGVTYNFPSDFPQIPVEVDEGGTGRQALTQYNVLVGAGTSPVALVAPSATSGVPLISQGSSANPAYGIAAIAGGGTGASTATGALNNLLPSQTGQNGKILGTDGTDASWVSVPGTGTVTSVTFTDGLTADQNPCVGACTASLANIADDRMLANVSGGSGLPTATTNTDWLDATVGSAQGSLIMRGAASWGALTPGTNGYALLSAGPGSDLVFGQYLINNLAIAGQAQGDLIYNNGSIWTRLAAGTAGQVLTTGGAAANPSWAPLPSMMQGRLTLTSATPVLATDVTAATSVYYTPYVGNTVVINGSATTFTELTLALDSNSGHTGYQQSGKNFDLFVGSSSGVKLCTGPAWSSDTARGTGAGTTQISQVSGIWVNTVSMTCRFGSGVSDTFTCAVNGCTYVGTMRATADGQTTMQFNPSPAAGGNNTIAGLWNAYNRVFLSVISQDNTTSWSYGTATTWRAANNNTNNRINYIDGLGQSPIMALYSVIGQAGASSAYGIGLGLDWTTGSPNIRGQNGYIAQTSPAYSAAHGNVPPSLGYHNITALEWNLNTTAATLFGANANLSAQTQVLQIALEM